MKCAYTSCAAAAVAAANATVAIAAAPATVVVAAAAAAAYRRERLQFRADGTAKVKGLAAASLNSHIIFSEGEETEGEEEDIPAHRPPTTSSSNSSSSSSNGKVTRELREAFLQQMRAKMESVHLSDKVRLGRDRGRDAGDIKVGREGTARYEQTLQAPGQPHLHSLRMRGTLGA